MSSPAATLTRLPTQPTGSPIACGSDGFGWFLGYPPAPLPYDRAVLEYGAKTLRLVLEVLTRRRPVDQLAPLLDPQALRYLATHVAGAGATRRVSAALIGPVRMCQPHVDGAEINATFRHGNHIGALVARFDLHPIGPVRWQLTVLRIG